MFTLDSFANLAILGVGFILGYIFHSIVNWCNQGITDEDYEKSDDIYDRVVEREMNGIDQELEAAISDWVHDEFPDHFVIIIEDIDDQYTKLVTLYDIDDSQVVQTTKRLWEIINICENDYNVDRRRKFNYIPNVHSHTNTKRFFKQYLREKEDNGEQV